MDLYHINQNYVEIINQLYENGGEITPEIEELMAQNADEFNDKAENYMKAIRNLEADQQKFKEEAAFFTDKAKRAEKTVETLNGIMVKAMELRGINKCDFGSFKASLRKSKSVSVTEDFFFDGNNKYIRVKESKEPDKKAIKEAIESGIEIVGATLNEKNSLQIK